MVSRKNYLLPLWLLGLHVVLGVLSATNSTISFLWGIVVIVLGLFYIQKYRNRNNEAALWAAYYTGLEVLLRMTGGNLSWEIGKYVVILFLSYGFFIERRSYRWNGYWVWCIFFLSLPSVFQTITWSDRLYQDIAQNLSGLVTLCVASAYFYKRPLLFNQIVQVLFYYLLPVIAMCFTLFVRTPDFSNIHFVSSAMFETSGGFGPNQVATSLGFGWLTIAIYLLYRQKLTPYFYLDIALLGYILYRSLFTFSRGGNLASLLALLVFIGIHIFYKNRKILSFRIVGFVGIFCIIAFIGASYINRITDGVFEYRFTGKSTTGEVKEDITSNRLNILEQEFVLFQENPFGVGAGGSSTFRAKLFHEDKVASHNEFGRLLSEQGIFGIFIILILIYMPFSLFFRLRYADSKAFLALFVIISFSTMMHSAMRIALPAFFYGLSLILLYPPSIKSGLK